MVTVSVIVPLYKTEKFVERCVRSVMDQAFKDIEILCVDDCSPDGSADVVKRLMREDSRIKLIHHARNKGLGGARNTGILAASGEYVASVDSDDYAEPTLIEALTQGTANGHYDVVVCGFRRVDLDGKHLSKHMAGIREIDPITPDMNLFKLSNPAFWNKLWRTSLFTDNDIWFPEREYYQDQATTARIYSRARNLRHIGGQHYNYVDRPESIVNSISDKHLMDRLRVLDVLKAHFIADGSYEKQRANFYELIDGGFSYHSTNVDKNQDLTDDKVCQYLRHMLLLRHAYNEFDDKFRQLSPQQMLNCLINQSSIETKELITSQGDAEPRVLVLTLHSGENEYTRCVEAIEHQTLKNIEHKVISGLGNFEAHRVLYSEIMARRGEFDLFVKVDADMVLAEPTTLEGIAREFQKKPDLDHYIVACHDFMTGIPIVGMHVYTNRVSWAAPTSGIFLDPRPERPGELKIEAWPKKPVVWHSPDPSPLQAFHFGAHRALKVLQTGRAKKDRKVSSIREQWLTLARTWVQYKKQHDRRHGLALVAADLVFKGKILDGAHDYNDLSLKSQFSAWSARSDSEICQYVCRLWSNKLSRQAYFVRSAGLQTTAAIALDGLRHRTKQAMS